MNIVIFGYIHPYIPIHIYIYIYIYICRMCSYSTIVTTLHKPITFLFKSLMNLLLDGFSSHGLIFHYIYYVSRYPKASLDIPARQLDSLLVSQSARYSRSPTDYQNHWKIRTTELTDYLNRFGNY